MSNKICILWLALLIPGTAVADKSNCNVTLPVTVFLPDGALVRKLGKDEFVAKRKETELPIVSLAVNNGPKRTVFVVETGKQVPKAARSIETNVLSEVISDSRPEDSFALIASHGPHNEVRFGESRDTLRTAILGLEEVPKGQNRQNGTLDAVQEAVSWLQPHQPGDAIVVMTMGIGCRPTIRLHTSCSIPSTCMQLRHWTGRRDESPRSVGSQPWSTSRGSPHQNSRTHHRIR